MVSTPCLFGRTVKATNLAASIILLLLSTMIASYYIVHGEEYIDYNYHIYKKKATKYQTSKTIVEETNQKKSKVRMLFEWITAKRSSNIILVLYGLLSLLLIMDNKDIFVPLIFTLEVLILPIHMMLLATATPEDTKLKQIYYWYLPIFVSSISMVLFRYLLFFQK